MQEKFEDTKGVMRSRKLKNRQYNGQISGFQLYAYIFTLGCSFIFFKSVSGAK